MRSLPLLILLLTATTTLARLGETKAECETRYGKPVKDHGDDTITYENASFSIRVTFSDDKAVTLRFESTKRLVDPFSTTPDETLSAALDRDEIKDLLAANTGNSKWEQSETDKDFWNRADNKAYAIYNTDSHVLSIIDEEFSQKEIAAEEKEAAAKLKGFDTLGKTKAQLEKLYGKPIGNLDDDKLAYHKADISISVTFLKDKAARIIFLKSNPDSDDDDIALSTIPFAERQVLLEANGNGLEWFEGGDPDGEIIWQRKDHKAVAFYNYERKTLVIYDREYFDQLNKKPNDDDDAK